MKRIAHHAKLKLFLPEIFGQLPEFRVKQRISARDSKTWTCFKTRCICYAFVYYFFHLLKRSRVKRDRWIFSEYITVLASLIAIVSYVPLKPHAPGKFCFILINGHVITSIENNCSYYTAKANYSLTEKLFKI